MYTKRQIQRLRDELLSKKNSIPTQYEQEGHLINFLSNILIEDCDPDFVKRKICECSRFDHFSYGLLHKLFYGDPAGIYLYINTIFSIIVNWRISCMDQELLTGIEESIAVQ